MPINTSGTPFAVPVYSLSRVNRRGLACTAVSALVWQVDTWESWARRGSIAVLFDPLFCSDIWEIKGLRRKFALERTYLLTGFVASVECLIILYLAICAGYLDTFSPAILVRVARSSSSPPQPQKSFENPLILCTCSFVRALMPPKIAE